MKNRLKVENYIGQTFGGLTILGKGERVGRFIGWKFKCECGQIVNRVGWNVINGKQNSCGCWLRNKKLGSNNPMWKGKKVGRLAIHDWMRRNYQKPKKCEKCKKKTPYDLANISDKFNKKTYTRDIKNWRWLCRGCHMQIDGRLKNVHKPRIYIEYNGKTKSIKEWAKIYNLRYATLAWRFKQGIRGEKLMSNKKILLSFN